ncbi:helix-turn-helix domain-containing protein [Streptomyces smaragdinus]|nr:winged helix-turn-helix domain-containing protein [Streptomyces smaragdinus]
MWEVVLSLQLLQSRQAKLAFDPWRREVQTALRRTGLTTTAAGLARLCPTAAYFPDFLTPGGTGPELEGALDRVLSTPRRRLAEELRLLARTTPLPPSAARLASGDTATLRRLGEAVRRYYAVAVAPYREAIRSAVAADRQPRAAAALSHGAGGLLSTFQPELVQEGDTLRCAYPVVRELPLRGRPLTLVPSFFCVHRPVALVDPGLPPVLVYPLSPAPGWLPARGSAPRTAPARALGRLIGSTRALVLDLLDEPRTTSRIAAELGVALASASRHASVLREAGLITSHRDGHHVLHQRTPQGEALLNG